MSNLQSKLYKSVYDQNPAPVVDFVRWLADTHALGDAPRILDVGCGPGRLLPVYAALGWRVTGMEPDPDYYEQAAEVAADFPNAEVLRGGFEDIAADGAYDLVAAVYDPFSFLLSPAARQDALARCFRALRPGGVLFLDSPNFPYILKHYEPPYPTRFVSDNKLVTHTPRHTIDYHDGLWTHTDTFTFDDGSPTMSRQYQFAIVNPPELFHLLAQTGFADVQTYNSYAARAGERLNGPRLMLSARRPDV